ncbi:hypothetical protein ACFL14_02875 [Patescibacteria group bacterium]
MATFFLTSAIFEVKITRNQVFDKKSLHVAEAGIQESFNYMLQDPGLVESGYELNGTLDNMGYDCVINLVDDEDVILKLYEITCTVDDNITGARKRITVTVRLQTYAKFAYFTTQEITTKGTDAWFVGVSDVVKDIMGKRAFVEDDQVSEGLTHTNGRFNFFHNPEFWSYISSVDEFVQFYPNKILDADTYPPNHIPIYMRPPMNRGADTIDFPTNLSSLDKTPPSKLLNIPANSTIELNGTNAIINGNSVDISNIWVIKASGTVDSLSGVLDGYLTIASTGKIYITDSITYAEESLTSDDVLGIYAEDNIVVKNNENISANEGKPITIDASIMSLKEFTVYEYEGFDKDGNPIGRKPPATLYVNGGVIQKTRGVLGHFNPISSLIIDGYTKNWRYDDRLKIMPPPFFPTTGEPEIISWKEEVIE